MMEETLYRFNPWWEGELNIDLIDRPKYTEPLINHINNKQIDIITGLRRVGKTSIIKLIIKKLIEKEEIEPKRIFYVSLDFYGLEKYSILEIIEKYLKLQKIPFGERVFLFLDEVAYKENFDIQLKNIYDTYNAKVLVSSSSSSILTTKKAHLTGRERITEILPLDFEEFLSFKKLKIKKKDKHLTEAYFENYMQLGGIPEYVLTEDVEYIKQLTDDIIYKDIIANHNIKEKDLVRDFFHLLMERAGKQLSLNKISKILDISVDTAKRYLEYFKETYVVYTINKCGKLNERIRSTKKIYSGDIGLRNAIVGFRDLGAIFENLVFLKIKNQNPCYIYKDGIEIDFFTKDGLLIEVKYNQSITEKQQQLFNSIEANKKLILSNIWDFLNL